MGGVFKRNNWLLIFARTHNFRTSCKVTDTPTCVYSTFEIFEHVLWHLVKTSQSLTHYKPGFIQCGPIHKHCFDVGVGYSLFQINLLTFPTELWGKKRIAVWRRPFFFGCWDRNVVDVVNIEYGSEYNRLKSKYYWKTIGNKTLRCQAGWCWINFKAAFERWTSEIKTY